MGVSIEDGITLTQAVLDKRNARRKEVSEAQAAIANEVLKQTAVDVDTSNVAFMLGNFQTLAKNYKLGDDIGPMTDSFQALAAANGVRVVDVSTLTDAIGVMNKEQGEADSANADEDAEIAALKDWATSYTKEDQAA